MRRKDSEMTEEKEIAEFLKEMSFGFLGTIGEDGWPHVIPLNYVYHKGNVYFHGSKIGQKIKDITACPQVTFTVAKEYAVVPSYYSDPKLACPATTYFKSVCIRGHATILEDLYEKAEALTAFMEKLQPEGGYDPIDPADAGYLSNLKAIAVVKIPVEHLAAKFKFGQNLKADRREKIIDGLENRNRPLDQETIELMNKYCPFHKNT